MESSRRSLPFTVMLPSQFLFKHRMQRNRVDLPTPFGPSTFTSVLSGMENVRSCSTSRRPYEKLKCSTSMLIAASSS